MKIAFVTSRMIVGGNETYIARKSKWLIAHGYDVVVVSEGGCYVRQLPKGVNHVVVENISLSPYRLSRKDCLNVINQLTEILCSQQVDVIEAYSPYAYIYTFFSSKRHKIPFFLNEVTEVSYDHDPLIKILTCYLDKQGLYFTLTRRMNSYIERKCHRILHPEIIPIPYEVPQIVKKNNSGQIVSEDNKEDYILTVARLSADKMYLKYLISDFSKLIEQNEFNRKVILKIVGDGPCMAEILAISEDVNKKVKYRAVQLLGSIYGESLEKLYMGCTLYVGIGTTIIMAAAYSKPAMLASGIYKEYAFGFWGEEQDKDIDYLGGDASIKYRQISFREAIKNFYQSSCSCKKKLAENAHKLFMNNCEMNSVMRRWDKIYSIISSRIVVYSGILRFFIYCSYRLIRVVYILKRSLQFKCN